MKKWLNDVKQKKLFKRGMSLLLSTVMLATSSSAYCILKMLGDGGYLIAYAAETKNISTISELVEYSKNYTAEHAQDTLNITIASTNIEGKSQYQTTATLYDYDEYVSMGVDELSAFAGTINITVDAISYFNFSKPLFGYIKDSAVINVTGGNTNGYLELRRPSQVTINNEIVGVGLTPILAEHVVHDSQFNPASENDYHNWKIKMSYYNEPNELAGYPNFPSVIGSIDSNCKLSLDVENDTKSADNQEHIQATAAANVAGANAGLICGTLGANADVIVSVSGSNTDFNVTSANGHAGALIGEMSSGSSLKLSGFNITGGSSRTITSSNGYAGGLVGSMTDASITFDSGYTINEVINGHLGAGGVAGYYNSATGNTFDLENASIDCSLTSPSAGGLFGVLETSGDFSLDDLQETSSIASTVTGQVSGSYYGGLVGTYKTSALANTFAIGEIEVSTKGGTGNCAGLIGKLDDTNASYVLIDGASVTNTITSGFCGVINGAGNAGHFLDIGNFTLSSSDYTGSGLVGTIGTGVIRLSGTTDLSGAKSSQAQLVNKRGNALIFAKGNGSDTDWTFERCTAVACDDIGNWGEVLRSTSGIITVDETAHTATVASCSTTISSTSDFVKTALNMQLNHGNRGALLFADDTNTSTSLLAANISISENVDLSGTGIMGLMRDDGKQNAGHSTTETDAAFTGSIDGNSKTVSLAIGEYYGNRGGSALSFNGSGNGTLHGHSYGGLLAVTNGATIKDLTIDGTIYTVSNKSGMCLGGFVGLSKGNITLTSIDSTLTFTGKSADTNAKYFGGLIGKAEGDNKVVSISGENHSTVETNAYSAIYASNSIGFVGDNTITINFTDYTLGDTSGTTPLAQLSNPSDSTQTNACCGGLIGYVNGTSKTKTINIDDTTISHYQLNLTSTSNVGGILGYAWNGAEVYFGSSGTTGLVVSDCDIDQKTASAGGLVHHASGYWAISKLTVKDTDFGLNNVTNFGVLVNKGYNEKSLDNQNVLDHCLYLELKTASGSGNGFDLSDNVTITEATADKLTVYDELVAYSAYENPLVEGSGVVSIHTASGTVVGGKYEKQITPPADALYNNPHTRYYYDLDVIRASVENDSYPTGSTEAEQNAYKLMMWNLEQYAHSSIQSYFTSENNAEEPLSGSYDLSKVSYYPLNRSSDIEIGEASFTFNNKNIEDSAVAGTTYRSTVDSNSQHYLMHCGLFYNVTGSVSITDDLTLSGSVGRHEHGSGAIVAGTFGNLTEGTSQFSNTSGNLITMNGLTINYPDTVTPEGGTAVNTYKPVLINLIGNHVVLNLNGVNTAADSYADGDGVKTAGSSLIGTVGTKDGDGKATSDSINLTFNDIRLDARKSSSPSLTTYGTSKSVFTKATLLDEFIFNNNSGCKGVYNYRLTEDWNTDGTALHHVTYGYEIDGTSEFLELQEYYIDRAGKTNPNSRADAVNETEYSFSNFLPYVAIRDYDEENATKRSREIMVNHTNVSITQGCGTYNDPYIIDSNGQIEAIAKILELGDMNDGFEIKVPKCTNATKADYKKWCGEDHIQLTYNNGTYTASNTTYNHTTAQLAKYLAGAYYKITKVTNEDESSGNITYESIQINSAAFNGLGSTSFDEYAFRGVIVGDSDTATYPLINNTGAPLIKTSYGSVVKGLKITVNNANIIKNQSDETQKFTLADGGCSNYGAVIGQILGGDNIIDSVSVDFTNATIKLDGTTPKIIPVGGYVGVVASGALIFKGTNTGGLTTGKVKNGTTDIAMTDTNWLYVNPIIGRVLNGYAVYEAASDTNADSYKYSEADVTMKNGTKNYSIADIDPDLLKLEVGAYTQIGTSANYTTDVDIPNAQAMYVLSMLTQSSTLGNDKYGDTMKVASSDSYNSYKMMRHATYDYVGTNTKSDYNNYAQYDCYGLENVSGIKWVPYLVEKYTEPKNNKYYALSLTNNKTVCNMTLSGNDDEWYLPDGFKGIGYLGYGKNSYDNQVISLHQFAGGDKTIHLNMSLKHYSKDVDNYPPCSNTSQTKTGFGLFNILRHNWQEQGVVSDSDLDTDAYKIKDLNLTGTVDYDVVDVSVYSSANVYNARYVDVGGFAGYCGLEGKNDLRIEGIDLSGLTVNGFKTAGGLFGYLKMAASADYLAKISDISATTSTLTVTSKDYVGGIVGRCDQIGLTIDDLSLDKLSVVTYFYETATVTYNNGAGGIIGWAQNAATNRPITLSNITVGSSTATTNLRIGYPDSEPYNKNNNADNYYQIATGGLIGRSLTVKNTNYNYSLIIEHCDVYNVDLYGHRVAGIIGHDAAGTGKKESTTVLLMSDVHVFTNKNASIIGITKPSDLKDRGCGGFVGVMWNNQNKDFIDCSIEGYTLRSFNDTGGISSNMQPSGNVTIKNFKASNLNISSNYHGAMFGYLKANVNGYNLLFDNIQFSKYGTSSSYIDNKYGYLVGNNGGGKIQLVGVSRQHLESSPEDHFNKIAGKSGNYNYNGGYIIWADTLGASTGTTHGTKQSDLNDDSGTAKVTVDAASPWVTVSPSINISSTNAAVSQVLTGDSIMANYAAADALSISTLADVTATGAQATYKDFRGGTNNKAKLFSTYETEMGDGSLPAGVSDFPVIAIDNNGADINNSFNSYVQLLTHQTYNFAKQANDSVYKINIYRCIFNGSTFTKTEGSGALRLDTNDRRNGFIPNIGNPDTDAESACFTLIDVQFLNPANTNEVAYHVYVPVLVKKLMKFSFKASSLPGTVYDYSNYTSKTVAGQTKDGWGTPSVTNLGTPVTVYFQYNYLSTVEEWQAMVDNGESLMWHANKKLLLVTASQNMPAPSEDKPTVNTRMVLVDANNSDRAYYAKTDDADVFMKNPNSTQNDYYLDLTKFKNGSGSSAEYFESENFGDKLSITASTTSNGKQAYVESAMNVEGEYTESVYAMAKINGTGDKVGFRIATDADSSKTKYYLTVEGTSDQPPTGLSESYYLTFFTDASTEPLRVILASSAPALSSSPQNAEVISHSLRCTSQTESALILGNIYKQEFDFFRTENAQNGLVNNGCDYIETDLRVEISVNNDTGEADTIIRYLSNDSINVYHSILLTLKKNDGTTIENTIYGTPTYSINEQKNSSGMYGTIASKLDNSTVSKAGFNIDTPTNTSSFIQIQDGDYDIKPLLIETDETGAEIQYGGAIIHITGLRTHFDYLSISNQFPYQPNTEEGRRTVGTSVTAISVLDSDQANIAYSNIRETIEDEYHVKYHSEQPSSASLVYVVDSSNEEELVQTYNMLGINPIDEPEYKTNIIIADGSYNATAFVDSALAGKIRWTLSLEKKNAEGTSYEQVDMSEYVSGNVAVSNRSEGAVFTKSGNVYVYDEDFTTPLDVTKLTTVYAMKTGEDLEALSATGVYANYKVTLSATLYTGTDTLIGDLTERLVDNSTVSDYIKYTNAKVLSNWVNP